MPIYEFACQSCGKRSSQLVSISSEDLDPCPHCGRADLTKLVSRFRMGRSEDTRVEELANRLEAMGEPDSPSDMRHMVREMGKAMDDDMADDMEEMFEADMEEDAGPD